MPVAAVVMWTRDSRLVCVTLGSSDDGRDAGQVVDGGLRHGRPGIGAENQGGVVVAAQQQVHGRVFARVEARVTAAQVDAERVAGASSA